MGLFNKFFGKKQDMPEIISEDAVKADLERSQIKKPVPVVAEQSQKKAEQAKKEHFEAKTRRCDFCGRKIDVTDENRCNSCAKYFCDTHLIGSRHNCKGAVLSKI